MTVLVLDAATSQTSIGDLLARCNDSEIQIQDESGRVLATLILTDREFEEGRQVYESLTPEDLKIVRERARTDNAENVGTSELLARLNALKSE